VGSGNPTHAACLPLENRDSAKVASSGNKLRLTDKIRAKFGHGKTIFELDTKKQRDVTLGTNFYLVSVSFFSFLTAGIPTFHSLKSLLLPAEPFRSPAQHVCVFVTGYESRKPWAHT
jgi:hypothetical protein